MTNDKQSADRARRNRQTFLDLSEPSVDFLFEAAEVEVDEVLRFSVGASSFDAFREGGRVDGTLSTVSRALPLVD